MEFSSTSFQFDGPKATPLDGVLKAHFADASWGAVRKLIETGKVSVDGVVVRTTRQEIKPLSTVAIGMNRPKAQQAADTRVLYVDPHIVVVNKPSGIASVDHEAEPTSLQSEIRRSLELQERRKVPPLKVVHRIDKVTSGVMLFARTAAAQSDLKEQFKAHTTGRIYLAVAHGSVHSGSLSFRLVRDRGDGVRGVTQNQLLGYPSTTHVRTRETFARCTLIECKLETGRTHQIRIHLAEIGHPLVGEPLYIRDYKGVLLDAPRTMLHAAQLSFTHPTFRNTRRFEVPLPAEFATFVDRERTLRA
jgi:23S rRNA pseudouridine1911/1915/1917 synthase